MVGIGKNTPKTLRNATVLGENQVLLSTGMI